MNASKRQQEEASLDDDPQVIKKARLPENETNVQEENQVCEVVAEPKIRRRKVALLLSYSGWGYLGMQR